MSCSVSEQFLRDLIMRCSFISGLSLWDAYWHVKRRRHCVSPNEGFMGHLAEFERKVRGNGDPNFVPTIDPAEYR